MSESIGSHHAVRDIVERLAGESIAALRSSGACRILQPPQHGGLGLPADEFVWAVCELAAVSGSLGWLAAIHNAAANEVAGLPSHAGHEVWDANPDAVIAIAHRGSGDLANGRLTGRWESVAAEQTDWLLLPAGNESRVLVRRSCVRVEPADRVSGLGTAGLGEVIAEDLAVDDEHVFTNDRHAGLVAGAGVAAAVVGSADGVWRTHVDKVRARLDFSYGGHEVTDEAAAEVARAASDIDVAKLQITGALDPATAAPQWAFTQAVARARDAADRLLTSGRHALDASDPVTDLWRDVHAGCRLAVQFLDDLSSSA